MARKGSYRLVDKALSHNRRIGKVSDRAGLAYYMAIPHHDSAGRIPGDPHEMLALCFPICMVMKGWTAETVLEIQDELHQAGLWRVYEADGVCVVEVLRYQQHQHPSRLKSEPASTLPAPTSTDLSQPVRVRTDSCLNQRESNRTEGKGREETDPPADDTEAEPHGPLADTVAQVLSDAHQGSGLPDEDPFAVLEQQVREARAAGQHEAMPLSAEKGRKTATRLVAGLLVLPAADDRVSTVVAELAQDRLLLNAGVQVAERMQAEREQNHRVWSNPTAYLLKSARLRRDELVRKMADPVEDVLDGHERKGGGGAQHSTPPPPSAREGAGLCV